MTAADNVLAAWALVDTATNDLAARVQVLIDEINNTAEAGLTGDQTEAVLERLAGLKDSLNAMGQNPANPVPNQNKAPVTPIPGPLVK